jgi:hypothetical protein
MVDVSAFGYRLRVGSARACLEARQRPSAQCRSAISRLHRPSEANSTSALGPARGRASISA